MAIKTYDTLAFLSRFMTPSTDLDAQLRPEPGQFFIVPLETMYRQVNRRVPPSRSLAHSCLLITGGAATMTIGFDTYTATAGELLFVPAGQVFSFGSDDVNEGYLLHIHPNLLLGRHAADVPTMEFEFLTPWGNLLVRPPADTFDALLLLTQRLLTIYQAQGIRSRPLIQSYLTTWLCEVAETYQPVSVTMQTAAYRLSHAFKTLLTAYVRTQHRVTDYASQLNITPNHLNKVVKETTGKSPTRWIDEALVLEAKVLLSQTADPVSTVADQLGFSDPSYFSRLFRRYEGVTPIEFRRMIDSSGS
ncbi:helix-turn-helix domain-containing protein [Spirosoma rhododendri]|uniref:AraC family transcriptional regulator n=1 Tax=Spirosoma rhododendri TaxID=2728024 RepID=A0A7L5DQH9_9BACT|nr:AraC family transcriptional regulator [Spirosoma rhododendri]QJD79473.1 AraC family transcriptional regulator [Spirosoma rhododendri]